MKSPTLFRAMVLAGIFAAAPLTTFARDHHGGGSGKSAHFISGGSFRGAGRSFRSFGGSFHGYGYRPYFYNRPYLSFGYYSAPAYYYDSYPNYAYDSDYDSTPAYSYYGNGPRPSYRYNDSYDDNLAVDVQRALARRGYYHGEIDGDIGPASRAAIRAYQYERGLEVTGRIDTALIRSLRIG